jgi:uncharacterized protein YegL
MSIDLEIRQQDLVTNPSARIAVCLVLDCSPSMGASYWVGGKQIVRQSGSVPIDELNKGVKNFIESIKKDDIARYSAEISIVTFSGKPQIALDFHSIERINTPILQIDDKGGTSIGSAVELALKLLEKRKIEYGDAGVDYYQPWLVLMTDGQPTDYTHLEVSKKVQDMVLNKKLTVFPIGIGDDAENVMKVLSKFSPKRRPLRLKGLNFPEFFEWLGKSVYNISESVPGENVPLDIKGIKTWAEFEL